MLLTKFSSVSLLRSVGGMSSQLLLSRRLWFCCYEFSIGLDPLNALASLNLYTEGVEPQLVHVGCLTLCIVLLKIHTSLWPWHTWEACLPSLRYFFSIDSSVTRVNMAYATHPRASPDHHDWKVFQNTGLQAFSAISWKVPAAFWISNITESYFAHCSKLSYFVLPSPPKLYFL